MSNETFDIQMSVILCKKHKKFFETEVKVYVSSEAWKSYGKRLSIQPVKLTKLLHDAERCTQCRWKTLFDGAEG